MAAKMLCAYYDNSCDSRALFAGSGRRNDLTPRSECCNSPEL